VADLWVPGSTIRKFTDPKSPLANANMVGCAHTQVGSYEGSWNWGNQDGNPYALCYCRGSGELVSAWPVNLRSAANLEGNPYVFPIECEDVNPLYFPAWSLKCGDVPAWTDAQVQTLIETFAWWCIRFNRPPVLIPDTKPGRVGLAYHRQGVPNSPEWVTGNDKWSSSVGKCCPDWRRIAQFKQEVVPGVAALVNGDDMIEADFDRINAENLAVTRAEVQRLAQYLAKGESNTAFPAAAWSSGTTNPELLAAIPHITTIDVAALAVAIVAAMPPTQPGGEIDQATVEAGVRAVVPEIAAAVIAEIAS